MLAYMPAPWILWDMDNCHFLGSPKSRKRFAKKWEDRMDHRMNHRSSSGGSTGFHRPKAGFHPTSAPAGNGLGSIPPIKIVISGVVYYCYYPHWFMNPMNTMSNLRIINHSEIGDMFTN